MKNESIEPKRETHHGLLPNSSRRFVGGFGKNLQNVDVRVFDKGGDEEMRLLRGLEGSLQRDDPLPLPFRLFLDFDVGAGRCSNRVDVAAPSSDDSRDGVQRHRHFLRPERRVEVPGVTLESDKHSRTVS
ncbi:unnamed protein product [Nesidiocoris tenuis]|uniref:Uncharacterized protein n=1 Tax=Nesidiocoris tenuis TaxID=355587 RepID=A0A6H5GVE8_9HEMI|nr:unnamed protein product [Nesidiocoris tenuis]